MESDVKSIKVQTHLNLAHEDLFNNLREIEFSRLDSNQQTYLDYTGGNIHSASVLKEHYHLLNNNVFGNPHSTNPTSMLSTKLVEEARAKVLDYFNAEDYYCVFTQNASGALKIVGECYPFNPESHYLLLADDHNSVNGIREYSKRRGSSYTYASIHYEDLRIDESNLNELLGSYNSKKNKLFAFPAQSNVSGVKHDLNWIEKAQNKGWDVLLDAAAFVPTNKLDLKIHQPEFVSISFYKMFGYPTGLGCLLLKKSAFNKLEKPWFAGGTVKLAAVLSPHYYLSENHERFENGTIDYLGIPALKFGLEFIENIGLDKIKERVSSLINYLYHELNSISHHNGKKLVKLFGPSDRQHIGGTLIMTFFDQKGNLIPFEKIESLANKKNISVRSGCFCNPGIDEVNNCLTTQELSAYFSSRDNGDYQDMIHYLHKLRGATRVSVGIPTTKKDLDTFIDLVKTIKDKNL